MNYEYVSDNIIICKNFLPDTMLQKIKIDLMNNRGNFGIPIGITDWTSRKDLPPFALPRSGMGTQGITKSIGVY